MTRDPIIYGLFDPRDGELRYVGKARNGLARCLSHWCPSALRAQTLKIGWVKSLLKRGLKPVAAVIQRFTATTDLDGAERHWIEFFRSAGCRLTNMTKGGDGTFGVPCSASTRAKISAAQLGISKGPRPLAAIAATAEKLRGRKRAESAIKATAAALRGLKHSPQEVAAMTERVRANWAKPGYAEWMARAHGGRPFVDQTGRRFETIQGAARVLGLQASKICNVLKGKRSHTMGFTFTYAART